MVVEALHPALAMGMAMLVKERTKFLELEQKHLEPIVTNAQFAEDVDQAALRGAGRRNIDRFERSLVYLSEECGVRLGYLQEKLLKAARICLLKRMMGADVIHELDYLKSRFGITVLKDSLAVIFPRRAGKTTIQTIIAACVAVSQPDGNVCCFNIKLRQSVSWLAQTIRWMELFQTSPEFHYTELKRSSNEFLKIRNCTGTTAQVSSYPGT
jgi:hypothetical protein